VGKTLREADVLRDLGLIVIGIRSGTDGGMLFNPSAQTAINAADTLIVLGKPDNLSQLHRSLR
jgi:Trk K+ transport system NAD-binding subunit